MIKSWERVSALQLKSYKCKGKRSSAQEPDQAALKAKKFEREWQIILQNWHLLTFTTYYNEGHLHCLCGITTCPFTHPDFKFLCTFHLSLCLIAIYSSSLKFKQVSQYLRKLQSRLQSFIYLLLTMVTALILI